MYKFDVRYTFENYYEYYKQVLINQRIVKDIIFALMFIGVGVFWLVNKDDSTNSIILPIVAFVLGVAMPLLNFITIPLIKKQIRGRQADMERTHIVVTFNEEEVVYENLSESAVSEVVEESKSLNEEQTPTDAEIVTTDKEATEDVTTPTEEVTTPAEEENKPVEDEKTFILKYNNFSLVRESKGLFMFYLDRQTVVILPKETFTGTSLEEFKKFIVSKIHPRRLKLKKEKVEVSK